MKEKEKKKESRGEKAGKEKENANETGSGNMKGGKKINFPVTLRPSTVLETGENRPLDVLHRAPGCGR